MSELLSSFSALSGSLAAIVERVGASSVAVAGRRRHTLAAGVVWRPGLVVTAAHVFRHAPAALTLMGDGGAVDATLVGSDGATDLALFRIADEAALPAVEAGDAAGVKPGHLVIAVGRSVAGDVTASHGIVNRAAGAWQTWLGGPVDRLIRLDGGLHEGHSGAAVADAEGRVIGIASAALSRRYGIVVPAATVSRVVETLLHKGHVARAFLGIGAQAMPPSDAGGGGLLVTAVQPKGPAAAAGLSIGDILVAVDGKPATSLAELRANLADRVGTEVKASLLRGGAALELPLTVGEWPTERRRC